MPLNRERPEMRGNELWYRGRKVAYTSAEAGGSLVILELLGPLVIRWILQLLANRNKTPAKVEYHLPN